MNHPTPLLLAYLNPTAGSLAFQLAIGSIVSAAAALRLYRDSLRRLFRRLTSSSRPSCTATASSSQPPPPISPSRA